MRPAQAHNLRLSIWVALRRRAVGCRYSTICAAPVKAGNSSPQANMQKRRPFLPHRAWALTQQSSSSASNRRALPSIWRMRWTTSRPPPGSPRSAPTCGAGWCARRRCCAALAWPAGGWRRRAWPRRRSRSRLPVDCRSAGTACVSSSSVEVSSPTLRFEANQPAHGGGKVVTAAAHCDRFQQRLIGR